MNLIETYNEDCRDWLNRRTPESIHAVVTDPPFTVTDFSAAEIDRMRAERGGVWRQPPRIGGSKRAPLPRFTVMTSKEQQEALDFFATFAEALLPVLVPGAHVFVATNPLLSHLVYLPMMKAGFEKRGEVIRLVQTLRGGDRPKNAEAEFPEVTVMPRSGWEPWGIFRKPLEGTVAECLRKWGCGALKRTSPEAPFKDVITSAPTPSQEREIAPHPCLKPQAFIRQLVRASLPLGKGIVLDPFCGAGSVLGAAMHLGFPAIGVEKDEKYYSSLASAVPGLAALS